MLHWPHPVEKKKGSLMKTRDLIYCALFAALTAIGAFLHFQFMHATITLQCFFTAMAGLLLGARLGAVWWGFPSSLPAAASAMCSIPPLAFCSV